MNRKHTAIAAALVSLCAASATSARTSDPSLPYAAEIESCIDTLDERLELVGARHVRHLVFDAEPRDIGYALTIETTVSYRDGAVARKRYAAFCIARGTNDPSTLRIEEIVD